ncbi:hypothetical protein G9A89_000641 [Geosiphon pyriformis]|nr:hypothetical protein G9A89_000641 [Geosiphon pyriformis]
MSRITVQFGFNQTDWNTKFGQFDIGALHIIDGSQRFDLAKCKKRSLINNISNFRQQHLKTLAKFSSEWGPYSIQKSNNISFSCQSLVI